MGNCTDIWDLKSQIHMNDLSIWLWVDSLRAIVYNYPVMEYKKNMAKWIPGIPKLCYAPIPIQFLSLMKIWSACSHTVPHVTNEYVKPIFYTVLKELIKIGLKVVSLTTDNLRTNQWRPTSLGVKGSHPEYILDHYSDNEEWIHTLYDHNKLNSRHSSIPRLGQITTHSTICAFKKGLQPRAR